MTKTLTIPYHQCENDFSMAAEAKIDEYTWGGPYQPKAKALLYHTDDAICICLQAEEKADHMRIVEGGLTGRACCDSCMEFFLMPCPEKDERYFNFELTAGGAIFLGVGHDRYDNTLLKGTDLQQFDIQTEIKTKNGMACWQVQAKIPYQFLRDTLGIDMDFAKGTHMRGNIYKCADDCLERHYGTWNVVGTEHPDYHQPGYFGDFYIG